MKNPVIVFAMTFMFVYTISWAQEGGPTHNKINSKYLDVRFENGAMLGNTTEFSDQIVNSSYYNGADIRLSFRKTNSQDIYSNVYRRPYFGLGVYSSTFNNEEVGSPGAVYFFLTIPLKFEGAKKWTFSYTGAFGLSYNFNPYDPIKNPTNMFVGSYRNCYVHLGFIANYKFNESWALNGTIGFKHFSNGSFKQPNFGINLIPLTIGVSYKLDKEEILHEKKPIPKYLKHSLVNVALSAGSKNYQVGGDNYFKGTLTIDYLRQINYKYRIGAGLDFFYSDRQTV